MFVMGTWECSEIPMHVGQSVVYFCGDVSKGTTKHHFKLLRNDEARVAGVIIFALH